MSKGERGRLVFDGIGLAAVLAGLVFVGFEIRQNTLATQAATQQAVFDATLQAHWGVIENERLRELIVLTRDDPTWVTATPQTSDHLLLERFYQQRFNTLENAFYHYSHGNLDPELWAGWDGWIRSLSDDPVMSYFWSKFRGDYMPELADYMASILDRPAPP